MFHQMIECLKLPEVRTIQDLDHFSTSELHARIIQRKPFLKNIYLDFYKEFATLIEQKPQGMFLEIGSGGGFLKKVYPKVVTSDILPVRHVDICLDAQKIPLRNGCVDGVFLINVFHHISSAAVFLREMDRCLRKGGKMIMIEPANTVWSRFVYRHLHHEPFEPESDWEVDGEGPLSHSNSALPWIVFERDRASLAEAFPSLHIRRIKYVMPVRYLLSGGLTWKQLVPSCCYGCVKALEWIISPLNPWLAMFFVITVEKE
jgi:SAM-dependent methyltransferase